MGSKKQNVTDQEYSFLGASAGSSFCLKNDLKENMHPIFSYILHDAWNRKLRTKTATTPR